MVRGNTWYGQALRTSSRDIPPGLGSHFPVPGFVAVGARSPKKPKKITEPHKKNGTAIGTTSPNDSEPMAEYTDEDVPTDDKDRMRSICMT